MNAHNKTQFTYARINCVLKDSNCDTPSPKILMLAILATCSSSSSTKVCPYFPIDFRSSLLKIKKVFLRLVVGLSAKGLSRFFQRKVRLKGVQNSFRCSEALALAIAWFLQFCISESSNMMAPSGASGSGSGEGAGGSRFRWASELADLFGSSYPANSEAGLNQLAPDSPNPGEPAGRSQK
ncbi:hypothetical protein H5410_027483 [Solanum commersonii]|uniref:Uncharacterized protein n=1 Tax=Solanum commersonii TaxID=4109 RepID=A0A9J5Z247_SOLCO|nr:hypothetical protein H5410_027483 [Solanum commersonii]